MVVIKSELGEMKNTKKLQADPVNVKTATKRRQLGITVQSIIVVCVLLSLQLCSWPAQNIFANCTGPGTRTAGAATSVCDSPRKNY